MGISKDAHTGQQMGALPDFPFQEHWEALRRRVGSRILARLTWLPQYRDQIAIDNEGDQEGS